jgi:hypothetical protein
LRTGIRCSCVGQLGTLVGVPICSESS